MNQITIKDNAMFVIGIFKIQENELKIRRDGIERPYFQEYLKTMYNSNE